MMSLFSRLFLIAADMLALFVALALSAILARFISEEWLARPFTSFSGPDTSQQIMLYGIICGAGILYFLQKGHYTGRVPWWQQVQQIVTVCFFAFLVEGFINYALKTPITRLWVGLSWALAVPSLMIARRVIRRILMKTGQWSTRTILVGGSDNAIEILYALKSESYLKYDIACVVLPGASEEEIRRFRSIHNTVEIKETLDSVSSRDFVVICPDRGFETELKDTVNRVIESGARYAVVPPHEGFSMYGLQPYYFFGYNTVFLEPCNHIKAPLTHLAKTVMDRLGAAVALVLFSPLFLFIALKVKKDGGSAFYAQTRLGKDGRLFRCLKFRSMIVDADKVLERHLAQNPDARTEWESDFKLKDDPRITKIGHFLRKSSLDELPQFFNVLRGDMSLVGPRPIVEEERKFYGKKIKDYLSVKPGITGLWQVSGRNDITYDQRVYLDSWYTRNWSVWNDIVIIIKTVFVVLNRTGAY